MWWSYIIHSHHFCYGIIAEQQVRGIMMPWRFLGSDFSFFCAEVEVVNDFILYVQEELLSTFEDYIYNHIFPKLPKLFKNIPDFPLKLVFLTTFLPLSWHD